MLERFTQRFTARARLAVVEAVRLADERGGDPVAPADLLEAVLGDEDGVAARVVVGRGVALDALRAELRSRAASGVAGLGEADAEALAAIGIDLDAVLRRLDGPRVRPRRRRWQGRFDPAAKRSLELALREAIALRHNYVGTEHLLLGLVRGGDPVVVDALAAGGASYDDLRDGVRVELRRAG